MTPKLLNYQILFFLLIPFLNSYANNQSTSQIDQQISKLNSFSGNKESTEYVQLIYNIAEQYYAEEEYDKANQFYLKINPLSPYLSGEAQAFNHLFSMGDCYFWAANYDSAAFILNNLLDEPELNLTTADSAVVILRVADVYAYQGDYYQSHTFRFRGIDLKLQLGGDQNRADAYYALGEIYYQQGDNEAAILKLEEAAVLYKKLERDVDVVYCQDLIGSCFFEMKQYKKALSYQIEMADEKYGLDSPYIRAYTKSNLGKTYVKLKEYDKALIHLNEAKKIGEEHELTEDLLLTNLYLGHLHAVRGDCTKGRKLLDVSLKEVNENNMSGLIEEAYNAVSEGYYACGYFKKAFELKNEYIILKDSIENSINNLQLHNIEAIYEVKRKKQQMSLLQKENEVNRLYLMVGSCFGFLLLLFGIFAYRMARHKSAYNKVLREKNSKINSQYDEINNTNSELKEANNDLEQFAYIVSHDLKAPLRTIGSYTSLIKKRYSESFDQTGIQFMDFVTEGVSHMQTLLEDVLSYSQLKNSEVNAKPIDMQEVVNRAIQVLDSSIKEKDAELEIDVAGTVMGNGTQIFQVIQNLMDNALKFIPYDRKPKLVISSSKENDFIEIAIKDNGIGIKKEFQERIFTPFKRLHTKEKYKGTGVGLAICKRVVEKHGGQMWVESDGYNGTTFFFTLKAINTNQKNETSEAASFSKPNPSEVLLG